MNYTQCGSALALPYADGIAQTCVTSPPYYGLRDYGTAGQIGLEPTPASYVAQIVAAMREVWRVLRPDGTLWLNLGDSYANNGVSDPSKVGGFTGARIRAGAKGTMDSRPRVIPDGLKSKDLMGIPWRVAFALQDAGWYLRSDIIWSKANPMPESVTDRPTKAHEYVFLLAKQPRYYYDAEAIAEAAMHTYTAGPITQNSYSEGSGRNDANPHRSGIGFGSNASTRNARSVWQIATQPYGGAHFATMPPELARRCILAGTSARGECPKCGAPWVRQTGLVASRDTRPGNPIKNDAGRKDAETRNRRIENTYATTGWAATCDCNAGDPVPQIVLDPFAGSGTTAMVALQNGRRAIGTELNPKYLRLQNDRTQVTIGLGMVLA